MRYCYEWLPRWKLPALIDDALQRINLFSEKIMNETPCVTVSPHPIMYVQDIENFNFKSVKLIQGWITKLKRKIMTELNGNLVKSDCCKDLKSIANKIYQQLEKRFEDSFPGINKKLKGLEVTIKNIQSTILHI